MALYDLLVMTSLSGGAGAAYTLARRAGDGAAVIVVSLLLGLVAGIATWLVLGRVGHSLQSRSPYGPDGPGYVPTLRREFPFLLLYVAAVVGITASVIVTSSLVRLVIHHVA